MQYAINNEGLRIDAYPSGKAFCPSCKSEVIAKCGEFYIWHWAHAKNKSCDGWNYEPMSQWHLDWQKYFPSEQQEVVITKNDESHRADILTNSGTVIEIQHSPISSVDISKRENFYDRMVWIINATEFIGNLAIGNMYFDWWQGDFAKLIMGYNDKAIKFGKIDLPPDDTRGIVKKALVENGFSPIVDGQKQVTTYKDNRMYYGDQLEKKIAYAFYSYYLGKKFDSKIGVNNKLSAYLSWIHFRTSWSVSTKPIYLDLDNGYLLLLDGIKRGSASCRILPKQKVIDHYTI